MDEVTIQPVGGFVGAGGPGHVKSEGRMSMSALSAEDRAKVTALFAHPQPEPGNFYYRVTLQQASGTKTVNAPSESVPAALVESIKTELQ